MGPRKAKIASDANAASSSRVDSDEEGSIENGACCLCHCSLDYSDRAGFFKKDREEDYEEGEEANEYYYRPTDPYLPVELYDKSNALVYCDECDRMYHQKCHFVPMVVLPRGKWTCLVCQSLKPPPKVTTASPSQRKRKPGKHKNRSKANSNTHTSEETLEHHSKDKNWSSIVENIDQMFQSPPIPQARQWEQKWEFAVRHLKAKQWKLELQQRLKQSIATQATNYRMAETAVITLTSTKRNRSHFSTGASQELAQTLVKLYGARLNWREMCFSLDSIRRSTNESWHILHQFMANKECSPDFIQRILFHFGTDLLRRVEPRTPEMEKALLEQNKEFAIPQEILVHPQIETKHSKKSQHRPLVSGSSNGKPHGKQRAKINHDDDSGISLDNLQCCICHASTSTDENDLVMCDSSGCYRAYHMKCLHPPLTPDHVENDDDWFCPICSSLAETMLAIQVQYMGDDWEQERLERAYSKKRDDSSYKSWDAPDEVFPTVENDHAAALQMKQGKRNKATDDLLARVLGLDALPDHDDDDEEEDQNFDEQEFQKERKRTYYGEDSGDEDEEADDDSSHSSQATLVEMSSVELEIGRGELDALSGASSSDEESDASRRRSRRLLNEPVKKKKSNKAAVANAQMDDLGEFDEANIIQGKRGRKPVNYIQLNEAIFGDVEGNDAVDLDDTDEFKKREYKRKIASDSDDSSKSDDDSAEENDSSKEMTKSKHVKSVSKKSNRKRPSKKSSAAEPPLHPFAKLNGASIARRRRSSSQSLALTKSPSTEKKAQKRRRK